MGRQPVTAPSAPAAIGPYSQAIAVDGFVFTSGQLGMDATTGELLEGIEAQTARAMRNLVAVLDAAGLTPGDIVKTTIFLADLNDFQTVNSIYAGFVADPPPARSTVQVAALPRGARIEIEAVARRSS